jgi:hypothetical protein
MEFCLINVKNQRSKIKILFVVVFIWFNIFMFQDLVYLGGIRVGNLISSLR